jgi:hypothetical protein
MKLFSHNNDLTVGALIDVGSASVLVAIIASTMDQMVPTLVWSHREHIALRNNNDLEQLAKNVIAAFLSATMSLDTTGRQVLAQALPKAPLPSYLFVTVAAPWSYTVSKTITYSNDSPFTINDTLLRELERSTEQKIALELKETDLVSNLGLAIVTKSTSAMTANGYPIRVVNGQLANTVSLARTNAIIQKYLGDAISECHEKMWGNTTLHRTSFMFAYFSAAATLYTDLSEYCLVDVTYEATEMGVVRDGVLQYCTHMPYGAFSLARDVAKAINAPFGESYGRLVASDLVTADKNESVTALYRHYESSLTSLFNETGDALSIPKTIILHANVDTESFFSERLKNAAASATGSTHRIIAISKDIVDSFYSTEAIKKELATRHETALLVSAQFFHTNRDNATIEWL